MHCRLTLTAALAVVAVTAPASGASAVDASPNVTLLARFPFPAATSVWDGPATDIEFSGRYAYVGQEKPTGNKPDRGGVYIFDLAGKRPRRVGFVPCFGNQNDVAVVRPGLLAIGYHKNTCGRPGGGVALVDVSRPASPRVLGDVVHQPWGTHTLTAYPGKPYIYASPGGWGRQSQLAAPFGEAVIDVSNPQRPKVLSLFGSKTAGCHDLSFHVTGKSKLAVCAGGELSTELWDVSDPVRPKVISTIVNPANTFHHSAEVSPDGKLLVIGEESWYTECSGGVTGSLWMYDISDPALPRLVGHYDVPRGPLPSDIWGDYTCSAHNYRFIPGSRTLVTAWYQAGMNVIDLSDPSLPKELAHYDPAEGATYWSAYWHRGRIYASGVPGLDVFEVRGIPARGPVVASPPALREVPTAPPGRGLGGARRPPVCLVPAYEARP